MRACKVTTNGVKLPENIQKLVDTVNGMPSNNAKRMIANEIDFYVVDMGDYDGNYNNSGAWISGKDAVSFTVSFAY